LQQDEEEGCACACAGRPDAPHHMQAGSGSRADRAAHRPPPRGQGRVAAATSAGTDDRQHACTEAQPGNASVPATPCPRLLSPAPPRHPPGTRQRRARGARGREQVLPCWSGGLRHTKQPPAAQWPPVVAAIACQHRSASGLAKNRQAGRQGCAVAAEWLVAQACSAAGCC
jgi:hypothetical protein